MPDAPGVARRHLPPDTGRYGAANAAGGATMVARLRVPWAFVVRDFRIETSYKIGFLMRISAALVNIVVYYFIARVFGGAAAPYLQDYGGNYFAFVVIGVAFSDYLWLGINALSSSIREGQSTGTLELMLLSPTRLAT